MCKSLEEINNIFAPKVVVTTSRRKSPLTNTFIKALSTVLGSPIIRRGASNLDEIAYIVKSEGYEGFLVVYTRLGNPSVITLYKLTEEGYFSLFGRIFLLGVHINRRFTGFFNGVKIEMDCESAGCENVYDFLIEYFRDWQINPLKSPEIVPSIWIVKDLHVYRQKWLKELRKDEKFKPAEIEVWDRKRRTLCLKMRIHHVWRHEQ
ncbi:MAG: hypothetical protein ACTSX9_04510 [Candidatus Njordarchaeales archaeon]